MSMVSAAAEKTEEELRKEIDELNRQQREITERLRDPRGIRRGGLSGSAPRNFAVNGSRRGLIRPADRTDSEDQHPPKKRLSSAVVKVEDGEILEDASEAAKDSNKKDISAEEDASDSVNADQSDRKSSSWSRRDGYERTSPLDSEVPLGEHVPRVLRKDEDPSSVSRNRRMLGQLLGTLEKFRKEDMQLSGSEAYMRRSDSLKRAEQRAREESQRLREQEREQIAEKRKRDLSLRARIRAKAEEKKLDLLFIRWSEHHRKLGNFIRTKAEPPIYYTFAKPMDEDATLVGQQKEQMFEEWKAARREELSQYQKQLGEQYIANVEKELERWQNAGKGRKAINNMADLQESMDKELDTHRLEHGPKTRKIPGGSNNEDEEDVEDINVGEDDMMDDVLEVDENRRVDETLKSEAVNGSPNANNEDQ